MEIEYVIKKNGATLSGSKLTITPEEAGELLKTLLYDGNVICLRIKEKLPNSDPKLTVDL